MQNKSKGLPESIKQTAVAGVPLLVVIILFAVVGNFGISKLKKVQSEIKSARVIEKTLTQKLDLLKSISQEVSKTGLVNSALPSVNPSLAVIGQIKNVAITNTVILSGIKSIVSATDTSDLKSAFVSFNVTGARAQVFSFLNDLAKVAPIVTIGTIKITEEAGATVADIGVRSYWADLPKTIPSITAPIEDLTPDEKKILSNVSNLIQPNFSQIQPSPSQADINPNPFGL